MSKAQNGLSYILFPKRCALCGEVIELDKTLCEECESLKFIDGKICKKCGREVKRCTCSRDNFSPEYKSFCAPYYFDGSVRKAVYRLKNREFLEIIPAMSESVVKAVRARFEDVSFEVVTCVPMSKVRRFRRGYNQSELLAKETALILGCDFESLMYKRRYTRPQRKSSARKRRANLYNAFAMLEGKDIRDKTVLIVDDVKTTGSTLSELAYTLKDAGAKAVYAASFSVTK